MAARGGCSQSFDGLEVRSLALAENDGDRLGEQSERFIRGIERALETVLLTELVSFVAYVIACGWPSVTGFGTWVKVRTDDCAAAMATKAVTTRV